MYASHHHRYALGAELICDLISTIDVARHRGNSYEIDFQIEVDGLDVLVREHHLVLIARNRCSNGKQTCQRRMEPSDAIPPNAAIQRRQYEDVPVERDLFDAIVAAVEICARWSTAQTPWCVRKPSSQRKGEYP